MPTRIGINGFGRMGRLAFRAAWNQPEVEFVHLNETGGDAACAAHLLYFDSLHGRWDRECRAEEGAVIADGRRISYSSHKDPAAIPWQDMGVEIVMDATGKHKTPEALECYFKAGVKKVIVAAPVKKGAVNIVMGVNEDTYDPAKHNIITAASCTTNCLAPVVKVIHEGLGIKHGMITTIHDVTNTQSILDTPHKDLRRARACGLSLIPTSTGSATAIGLIFPELRGRLDGVAVRVPLLNASLTDCVFEVQRPTTVEEVNALLKRAADAGLAGILGYEERPLVSVDYLNDPRSSIVDALSTMVTNGTQVKILAWYDNEWGYANRYAELARKVARILQGELTMDAPPEKSGLRNYVCVTAAYWADTLTDGALRMLVLFYFYEKGYSPLAVASLFLFYEIFGIITNLFGGWLGARLGLKTTLFMGLGTQLAALSMLAFAPAPWLTVAWVMVSQAFSGIAKDLTKMSSKSAVKLMAGDSQSQLYRWVAILTGSKNALKGAGFFLGGLLLSVAGFQPSLLILGGLVLTALLGAAFLMRGGLGTVSKKAKFTHMFSTSRAVNLLAAARVFLFGARDVWFVVALPVFLSSALGWKFWQAGGFMAVWIIGYGIVQAATPALVRGKQDGHAPDGRTAAKLAAALTLVPAAIALALETGMTPALAVTGGLILFGLLFALNSSVHSFLILDYADSKKVAQSVGFYYMANACGRLAGTILSGALYQHGLIHSATRGLSCCLWASTGFLALTALLSLTLPVGVKDPSPA